MTKTRGRPERVIYETLPNVARHNDKKRNSNATRPVLENPISERNHKFNTVSGDRPESLEISIVADSHGPA
ncbi:MAG: hypothetical protein ACREQW_00450 [Candidatus Binatia bacterium]